MSIKINNLTKSFNELTIFENFNIEFENNKISCLLGPSGCGKTTLLNLISELTAPNSMEKNFDSKLSVSYIFQEPRLLPWMTVFENLNFVLCDVYKNKSERKDIIETYLKMVNLYEFKDYLPKELSGGMKQRLSIARAFAYPSEVLLMDEPFIGLDISLKKNLMNAFLKLWEKDKRTVIFVTHDIDEAITIAHKVFVLSTPPANIIFQEYIDSSNRKNSSTLKESIYESLNTNT